MFWFPSLQNKSFKFNGIHNRNEKYKDKKLAFIIIETNKAISGVKSSINDGLNKQSHLLGKINPKCTLLPALIGLF